MQNPSADRFGPPAEQAKREAELARTPAVQAPGKRAGDALWPTSLFVGVLALRFFAHSRRGWVGGAAGLLALVLYLAQIFVTRKQKDRDGTGPDPYTPPTSVTR